MISNTSSFAGPGFSFDFSSTLEQRGSPVVQGRSQSHLEVKVAVAAAKACIFKPLFPVYFHSRLDAWKSDAVGQRQKHVDFAPQTYFFPRHLRKLVQFTRADNYALLLSLLLLEGEKFLARSFFPPHRRPQGTPMQGVHSRSTDGSVNGRRRGGGWGCNL